MEFRDNYKIERGDGVIAITCDADHCTPEERAVIDAAIARREAEKAMFPFSSVPSLSFEQNSDEGGVLLKAFIAEQEAVDQLLAARAGREEAR